MKYLIFSIFTYQIIFKNVWGLERELTVNVDPGKEDCFYERVKIGEVIDIEFQVIDGGHGDLDITFHIAQPDGRIIISDVKKPENNHRVDATMDGDYKFCFDNGFSAYNSKTIFFELIIEAEGNTDWDSNEKFNFEGVTDEEVTYQDVQTIIFSLKTHLGKVRHYQELHKSTEARDRNLGEEISFVVNSFSLLQLLVMLFVGFVQVLMIKSLFDDSSRVQQIWKKLNI